MKKTFILLLALLLVLGLFAACDARNGKVTNSPGATLTPGNTPGNTPLVTDVPSPTATYYPSATPDTVPSGPPETTPPTADNAAAYRF